MQTMSTIGRMFPWHTRRGQLVRRLIRPGRPAPDPVSLAFARYAETHPSVVFVNIGSHNGVDGDPLATWIDRYPARTGIMVEPVAETFAALNSKRGGDPRFNLVRAAITGHDGTAVLTVVDPAPDLPHWATQLSKLGPGPDREA